MKQRCSAIRHKAGVYSVVAIFSVASLLGLVTFLIHKASASSLPNLLVGSYQCNASNICTSYDAVGTTIGTGGSAGIIPLPTGFGTPQAVMANQANVSTTGTFTTPFLRIAGMGANKSKGLIDSGSTLSTTSVLSFSTDSFTVGSNLYTNGVRYGFVALRAAGGLTSDDNFAYGTYTGNGLDDRDISINASWAPDLVLIVRDGGGSASPVWRNNSAAHSGDSTAYFNTAANVTGRIKSLDPTGSGGYFRVGTGAEVNSSAASSNYYWIALKNLTGSIYTSSYAGDGTDNRNIVAGDTFTPDYAWTKHTGANQGVNRYSHQTGDLSQTFQGTGTVNIIQALNSTGFQVGSHAYVNTNGSGTQNYGYLNLKSRTTLAATNSTFTQSAYRWMTNNNATTVGAALANQDTAMTAPSQGNPFRLRMLMHVATDTYYQDTTSFKLQVAARGVDNSCDTSFSGETYSDVTQGSGVIRYYNNSTPVDNAALTTNGSDPTHSGHTVVAQSYEESNTFANTVAQIPSGQDGEWDFSLVDNSAANDTTYCFRAVKSDGSLLDTYSVIPELTTAPSGSITISSPSDYQLLQRNGSNQANIAISGTYTGSPTSIEARFNGGSWSTIVASPSSGSYSGTLSSQSAGQGSVEVRFSNATSITTSKSYVGIGDLFVIAGDSNGVGQGTSNQSYSHASLKASLFKNNDSWGELVDPTDSNTGQSGSRASYDTSIGGSFWPLLATKYMADRGIPVGFIAAAKNGSAISGAASSTSWQRKTASPTDTTTLYGDMYTKITAAGGSVKAVLFFEGANDLRIVTPSNYSLYQTYVNTFVNDVMSDFGVKTMHSIVGDCIPAYFADCGPLSDIHYSRQVIYDVWGTNSNIFPGPTLYDINKDSPDGDGIHYRSNSVLQTVADRTWLAIRKQFYDSSTDARGPQLTSAQYNAAKTKVYLKFTDDSLPILPTSSAGGIVVYDNGSPMTISSTTRTANDTMLVNLSGAASGTMTVSICDARDCSSPTAVIHDSSSYSLPVEMAYNQSTSLLSDTTAPTGSVSINGGAASTTSRSTTLTIAATDDIDDTSTMQMQVSNDSGFSGAVWEAYATSKAWTLTNGTGTKTVYVRFKDSAGNTSTGYSDTITLDDSAAPTGSIDVNSGASTTNTSSVTLTLSATDDIDSTGSLQMMVSNDSGFTGGVWEAYATSKAWTLSAGTGSRTVYAKFKDSTGNTSGSYNDAITVTDTTAPTGSISVNAGASTTNNLSATLTLSATDDFDSAGSLQMMVSNDSGFTGGVWEAYATSKAWTLSSGTGAKTVYVKYKDSTGNTSGSYSDGITVADDTAPTGSVSINAGASTTNTSSVTLTISATDDFDSAGSIQMQVSNASDFSGASWEAYATSKAWTLSSGTGSRTAYVRFKDSSSNTSSGYSDAITVADNTSPTGSISIDSGAASTTSRSVTLNLAATDDFDSGGSLQMMVSNDSGFSGASYEAFSATKSWTLTTGTGTKTVYVKYKDSTSNESGSYSDTITLNDTSAPTGSVSIDSGAASTTTLSVTLTIAATDEIDASGSLQMMISNDSGFSGASYEAYNTSKAWTLSNGTGTKTVYVKFKDSSSNESLGYSDTITLTDNAAPSGSVSINAGASTTNTSSVTLTLSATDDIDTSGSLQMMVSNDSGFTGGVWEAYATSKAWTLSAGTGSRTVYAKFKDASGNSSTGYNDSITVADNTAPTGSISIDSGTVTTNTTSVTLTISATDDFESAGTLQMMISNDSGFSGASWEAYATSKAWTLSAGTGTKTVYIKFKDSVSNTSGAYNDTILYTTDTTAPTGSVSINAGASTTNTSGVTLTLSATDDVDSSGSLQMMISNDSGFSGASWEAYATSKAWTLSSGTGTRTVYAKFRDASFNASSPYNDAITVVDNTAPTGSVSINAGASTTTDINVTLTINASDNFDSAGSIQMQVSDASDFTGASWEAYATSKAWTLSDSAGTKTMYVRFKDSASNISSGVSDTIEYTPPANNSDISSGGQSSSSSGGSSASHSSDGGASKAPKERVILNDFPEFFDTQGVKREIKPNEVYYFTLKSATSQTEEHSITVKEIKNGRVTIVVASEPQTITLGEGETKQVDVDRNGQDDIAVTAQSISGNTAVLVTRYLSNTTPPSTPNNNSSNDTGQKTNSSQDSSKSGFNWWQAGIALVVLLLIGVGVIILRRSVRRLDV